VAEGVHGLAVHRDVNFARCRRLARAAPYASAADGHNPFPTCEGSDSDAAVRRMVKRRSRRRMGRLRRHAASALLAISLITVAAAGQAARSAVAVESAMASAASVSRLGSGSLLLGLTTAGGAPLRLPLPDTTRCHLSAPGLGPLEPTVPCARRLDAIGSGGMSAWR
jgi:hypothetical protein